MNPSDHRGESPPDDPDSSLPSDGKDVAPREDLDEVFVASLANDPMARLPHPHLGWAILWVLGLWVMQFSVSVIATAGVMMFAASQGVRSVSELTSRTENATAIIIPVGTFAVVLFAVVVAWLFYRRDFGRRLALRPLNWPHWLVVLLFVLPLAIISSEMTNWAAKVLPQLNMEILGQFASSPWPLVFVAACLFPAIGEEIFCRGFLGRGLVAHYGAVTGVFWASLLFGIMHIDPVQSIGAFVLGFGLHFAYLTTRSLLAPILIHLLNNAFAFFMIRNYQEFPIPGLTPLPDDTMVHTPIPVMVAAIGAVICLGGLMYQTRTRWVLPGGEIWSPGYLSAEAPTMALQARPRSAPPSVSLVIAMIATYACLLWALFVAHQSALA